MIAAYAAALAIKPEPHDTRMLVASGGAIVSVARDGVRRELLRDALDASYSPDGTFIAFARRGDLWVANSDGSGQRRLAATPNVEEWDPSWLPDGKSLVYTARVEERRTIRVFQLPTGPSKRLAGSNGQEYGGAVSASGRLAFVSTRSGTPVVYTAEADGLDAVPFNPTPPATPLVDVHDLAWSPDSTKLAYDSVLQDGSAPLVVDDGATQLTLPTGTRPVWSPTGTRVAFADEAGSLASVAADGTDLRALGEGIPLDWLRVPVGRPKFPNLVQRPPSGLVVSASHGGWQLGFTSMVDNRGPGILWIKGNRAPGARVMDIRQLVQLAAGGDARRPGFRRAALRRRTAALPLAHASASTTTSCEASADYKAAGARSQERLLHRRPLRARDRRTARPTSLPEQLRAVQPEGPSTSRRDRRSATQIAIPPSSTGRASTSRRSRPAATGSCTGPIRTSTCARRATTTTPRRSSSASRGTSGTPRVTPLRSCLRELCGVERS